MSVDGLEDVKVIGVYSSLENAHFAIAALSIVAGFSEDPDGFFIDEYILDKDHWNEGFVNSELTNCKNSD